MNEDFVTYEIAKKLKEKGFYYKCVATYDNDGMLGYNYIQPTNIRAIGFDDCLCSHNVENDNCIDAPTISQALKWLREKHNILISPSVYGNEDGRIWSYSIINIETQYLHGEIPDNVESYEQAALAGIEYVLDNLI